MSEVNRYLVYRLSDGLVVNAVLWNGVDEFFPGEGLALEQVVEGSEVWIGWKKTPEGTWEKPEVTEAPISIRSPLWPN